MDVVLLILCVIPGLAFSLKPIQEPWALFQFARANISLQDEHIATYATNAEGYRSEHSAGFMLSLLLLEAGRLPWDALIFAPIGSLMLAAIYYVVTRELTGSRWLAAMAALNISWFYPRLGTQYGPYIYAWTTTLFLGFVFIFYQWLQRRTLFLTTSIFVLFVAAFLHYQTTPIWIVAALAVTAILLTTKERLTSHKWRTAAWALTLACIVIYLQYDTVFYGNVLQRIQSGLTDENIVQSATRRIIGPLFFGAPRNLQPFEVVAPNPLIAVWLTTAILGIMTLSVAIWCIFQFYLAIRSRSFIRLFETPHQILIWSLIGATLGHTLIYLAYGAVSTRLIPLIFPILFPLVIRDLNRNVLIQNAASAGLALLSIAGFISVYAALPSDAATNDTGVASALLPANSRLLADPASYAALLLAGTQQHKIYDLQWIDLENYAFVIGSNTSSQSKFDYVIVRKSYAPMITLDWVNLEPFSNHLSEIEHNPQLTKLYDSENFAIFRVVKSSFVEQSMLPASFSASQMPPLEMMLRLTLVMIVFLVPGVITVLILQSHGLLNPNEPLTLLGLSCVASITIFTIAGVILSFTPVKLSSFGVIVLVPACGILAFDFFISWRRHRLDTVRLSLAYAVVIFAMIIIWALMAAGIAVARLDQSRFTELFTASRADKTQSPDVWVINRSDKASPYELFISDGNQAVSFGARSVAPGQLWAAPIKAEGSGSFIILQQHGQPNPQLRVQLLPSGDTSGAKP